jgi:hypothetical protein
MRLPLHKLISQQAMKIAVDCDRAAIRDSLVSAHWDRANFWLGLSSAVAAALSAFAVTNGANVFTFAAADAKTYADVFASGTGLLAALLASILTFLAPAGKAVVYHQFSNKYHALRDRIRSFIGIHCVDDAPAEELIKEFKALLEEKRGIDADHPVVPERYYRAAAERLEEKIKRNQRIQEIEESLERSPARASEPDQP